MLPPQLAPHAPWKVRFRGPHLLSVQVAETDAARALVVANRAEDPTFQLHGMNLATGETWPLTDERDGEAHGYLWPDGRWIDYLLDVEGSEVGHFVRVPFEGGPAQDLTPDLPPYSSFSRAASWDGRVFAFVAGDPQGSVLYVVDLVDGSIGPARPVWRSEHLVFGPELSADGSVAVVRTNERSEELDMSLVAIDIGTGERIGQLWDGPEASVWSSRCSPLPGDARTLAASNRTGDVRPMIWDPRTGNRSELDVGDLAGEIWPLDWSPDANRIVLLHAERARHRLLIADLRDDTTAVLAERGGAFDPVRMCPRMCPDGTVLALWQDSTHPPELVRISDRGEATTVVPSADVPAARPFRSVDFRSADGSDVQMWVAQPEGDGPFPLVLETHGGPQATMLDLFWPLGQVWLDHGFAFCTVNFHGSTGFGRAFERSIWGNPGDLEVQDIVAAREHLVRLGIADPDRVLLTGWSYGGFLTLMALGLAPEPWAGGMAGIAVADWTGMYEDSSDVIREFVRGIMGGTPEEVPERYASSSPITYLERVRAPALIVQGRNDSRCPAAPVERYRARATELGKDVEVVWFDSGHAAWTDTESMIAHHEAMLRFAYRVLQARSG